MRIPYRAWWHWGRCVSYSEQPEVDRACWSHRWGSVRSLPVCPTPTESKRRPRNTSSTSTCPHWWHLADSTSLISWSRSSYECSDRGTWSVSKDLFSTSEIDHSGDIVQASECPGLVWNGSPSNQQTIRPIFPPRTLQRFHGNNNNNYYYCYKFCSQIEVPEHSNCRLVPYWREFLEVSGSRTWSDTPFANT